MVDPAPPDEIEAVIALLLANSNVTALVGSNVFGQSLPENLTANLPPNSIVVQSAGGYSAPASPPLRNPRVDVRAFGTTEKIVKDICLAVQGALLWRSSVTVGASRLYKILLEADILVSREPDTGWPFGWQSFQVTTNR